jgi:hypothetical protein
MYCTQVLISTACEVNIVLDNAYGGLQVLAVTLEMKPAAG